MAATKHKTSEYTKNSYVYEASIKVTPNSESMSLSCTLNGLKLQLLVWHGVYGGAAEPRAQWRWWRWHSKYSTLQLRFCDRAHIILSAFWIFIMTWRTQHKLSLIVMLHYALKESAWIKLNHDECFTRFGLKSVQWQYAWDVEILRREQFVLTTQCTVHLNT